MPPTKKLSDFSADELKKMFSRDELEYLARALQVQPIKKSFTVEINFKNIPKDMKISARLVENVDLAEKGGYALMGRFVSSYQGGDQMVVKADGPLVIMFRLDEKRAAVLILPTSDKSKVNSDQAYFVYPDPNFGADIKVLGDGYIFGIYVEGARRTTEAAALGPIQSKNVYYQVALDLHELNLQGWVDFPDNQTVVYKHYPNQSLHERLPQLPLGCRWGPEIGGIMTIVKSGDPSVLYFPDVLLESFEIYEEHGQSLRPQITEFLRDQARRMQALSKTFELAAKVYQIDT